MKILLITIIPAVVLTLSFNQTASAKTLAMFHPNGVEVDQEVDSPKQFIKELKRFVRSVNKERYQPDGYWDEVDDLWESLQVRKEILSDQFSKSQWSQVKSLERKFQNLRKKKTRLS